MNLLKYKGASLPFRQWISFVLIFINLELVLAFSSLGYIAMPPISITTLHVPVIIAAMSLGPVAGGLVGFAFGISSMWQATAAGFLPIDMMFSPWYSGNPFGSFMLAVVSRTVFGVLSGIIFMHLFVYFSKHRPSELKINIAIVCLTVLSYYIHNISVRGALAYYFPESGIDISAVIANLYSTQTFINVLATVLTVFFSYLAIGNKSNVNHFNRLVKAKYFKMKQYRKRYLIAIIIFSIVVFALVAHMNIRIEEIYDAENLVINSRIGRSLHHVLWQHLVAFDAAMITILEISFWAMVNYAQKMDEMKSMAERIQLEEDTNRLQTQMMNAMAHDIRTPLNAILGFTNLINQNYNDEKLSRQYLKKISTAGSFLMNLINDLLELSRMRRGKLTLNNSECNIIKVFSDVEDIIKGQTQAKEQTLVFDLDVRNKYVSMDVMRINQILLNLLGNAVKFTPKGGSISVKLRQMSGDYFEIRVKDTGIGMSKEFAAKVFEPFVREEAVVKEIQGTGLGMSIVKNLVDAMDGTIRVESEKGKGTEYIINVRFSVVEKETAEEAVSDDSVDEECSVCMEKFKDKHILLAEDNELNQEIEAELLSAAGLVVDVASNGKIAVEKVTAWPEYYDAILMDINMPVMGGYEAARTIRKIENEAAKNVPIFAMSGNTDPDDLEKARDAGMNDSIPKPIDMQVVMMKLNSAFTAMDIDKRALNKLSPN